jgi:hypothetical protein
MRIHGFTKEVGQRLCKCGFQCILLWVCEMKEINLKKMLGQLIPVAWSFV